MLDLIINTKNVLMIKNDLHKFLHFFVIYNILLKKYSNFIHEQTIFILL